MVNIGGAEFLVILIIVLSWVLPIWAIVDAAMRTDGDFARVGQSRVTWLVLLTLLAVFCGPVGTLLAIYYLVAVRPKVKAT